MTASHHELAFDALDRLSVGADHIATAIKACTAMTGVVVLATCNRFELYLDVDAPLSGPGITHATREVAKLVAATSGIDDATALASFQIRTGTQVATHLFAVASGLDSMVIGEREVAGQVKHALAESHDAHTCSPLLEMLFQRAARTSKRVAERTGLCDVGRSVVAHGLDVAEKSLPPWKDVAALLVGTGFYAGAVLAALHARGCSNVRVYSPSGRASTFAAKHDAVPVDDLVRALAGADIVLSCSGTRSRPGGPLASNQGYVVDATMLEDAGVRRLVLIDLALHNDIDPDVARLNQIDLLDLATLTAQAPDADTMAVRAARQIVDAAAADFEDARLGRKADMAVKRLRAQADELIEAKVAELVSSAQQRGRTDIDIDAITSRVRGPVFAQLHQRILDTKAEAIAAARAAESANEYTDAGWQADPLATATPAKVKQRVDGRNEE